MGILNTCWSFFKTVIEQKGKTLSTYEKQLEKQRTKIELMEKMNLDPKTWTMRGEVRTCVFLDDDAMLVVKKIVSYFLVFKIGHCFKKTEE